MTESVDDLIAFLCACLDADERVALAAIADDCGQDGGFEDAAWLDNNPHPGQYNFGHAAADLIRRTAVPCRLLAEVEAKRRILDLHDRDHECSTYSASEPGEIDNCSWVIKGDNCSTIRLLAQLYAGWPGWRDEWRA